MATGADGTLAVLLDDELRFGATTSTRLSNHLPMALVALHRLGASDERIVEFADSYRTRLVELASEPPLATRSEWLASRGQRGIYGPARGYFEAAIEREGIEATARGHIDDLVDGLGGAAFHGLIRLAYALESASGARVAAGLAYLSEVHMPLGERDIATALTDDPMEALELVAQLKDVCRVDGRGNIGAQMRAVGAAPAFVGVADWLAVTPDAAARLTAAAVALYSVTDDFTALHAVTASHAVRVVADYVADTNALVAWWFQAIAAAYLTIGAPTLGAPDDQLAALVERPRSWDEIAATATTSEDEHVIKLVYSARELHGASANELLPAVAARKAGLGVDGEG